MEYVMVRVEKPVHSKINKLGTCGMSKSQVIEKLIKFFYENHRKKGTGMLEQLDKENKKRDDGTGIQPSHEDEVLGNGYRDKPK
jgi:hypothetical protein